MSLAQRALDIVRKHGTARSGGLAESLGCSVDDVHELLLPYVAGGQLVACDVQVGEDHLKDYRIAAAAGGKAPVYSPYRSDPSQKKPPQHPAAAAAHPQEETPMSVNDKIVAAVKAHGPMTTREMKAHVKCSYLSTAMNQLAKAGKLARLGGGERSSIYGLPGQKAGEKGGKGAAARAPAPRAERAPAPARVGSFRPSITIEGAVLLSGAAKTGELQPAEIRVLAGMIERFHLGAA